MLQDATFTNEMRCHWHELRQRRWPARHQTIEALIDAFAAHIRPPRAATLTRWNNIGKLRLAQQLRGRHLGRRGDLPEVLDPPAHPLDGRAPVSRGTCTTTPAPPTVPAIPQPPQTANDRRTEQALASPPQFRPGIDPPAFIPQTGEPNPQWACPAQ